jgi:pimeloyl-ACP methyl ester carboxylesterase
MEAPYFGNPAAPLTSFWVNASLQPLTRDDPVPIPQGGTLRLPVLATLPNAGSGQIEPANGWPAVLVIHGVTVNRTVMLTLADAFAAAGFAVIAIDLPLHGVTNTTSPFYQGPGSAFGDNERHFNLDNVGPVGDLTPDGQIDNGWQILNVGNPLNARDNGRQTISDLIHLARTAPTMDFDGDTVSDIDGSRIHFVSLSLGSIFSTAFVAVNNDFSTATMSSPGGPFSQFLYDPNATDFGLPIRRGIEAQGLSFGTVGFDEFARDLQTVLDPIDPVNFAARAAANHPLHVIEILGDTAVTPALTDKVAELMGVADVSQSAFDAAGLRGIVRFTAGGHSSLFNPAIDIAVTIEMQTQTVTFAASGGTSIPIGDPTLVQ